jgi:polyisoprenyl-teichoic acid--peptidoglycan teichoic acid transferase
MLLGCLAVLLASAATSAVFVLDQVHRLTHALSENHSLKVAPGVLAPAGFGGTQTLLLVGNDQRAHTTTQPVLPHSNEMLLVRIDPSKPWISMMSIPRELMTTIQCPTGPVTTRFNYSLTCGGFSTLVSTVKQVTGLSVNHVVMIDFNNFKAAVDEMGCVYSTVDRRYFHVNTPTSQQYQEINLQPGYQLMCGTQALQFVSYRHGDTSLVRDARDQSFLLSAKEQYGPTLIDNADSFERIFGRLVTTDQSLHTTTGVLDLLGTLISVAGEPVRQVQFQANLAPTNPLAAACACVTASTGQIAASVHSFLDGGGGGPRKASTAEVARAVHTRKALARLPLTPASSGQLAQAKAAAAHLSFPLEYPRIEDAGGTGIPIQIRDYLIHAPGGTAYPAFVEVFSNGLLGQYYDVQGSSWTTPPLLDSPTQSVVVGGRTYYLYYTGQHLQVVAWYEHRAVYWIHNSLLDSVDNAELLAIAEQTKPIGAAAVHAGPTPSQPAVATAPPNPTSAQAGSSPMQTIGSVGGLLTLLAAPLLILALLKGRRTQGELRAHLQATAIRIGRLQTSVASAGVVAGGAVGPPITVYRPRRPTIRTLIAVSCTAVVALAAVAAVYLIATEPKPATKRSHVRHAPAVTVPVAVLNATQTDGAAAELARRLRAQRVVVSAVGNIVDSLPPGLEILYVPRTQRQAMRLASLLAANRPTVAPIDPVVQAAAGTAAKIAIVIS